jgi:alpha-tubulin suppressor-like RCC1 family protein
VGVSSKEPRQIFDSGVTSVGVAEDFICAVVASEAKCWGDPRSVTGSNAVRRTTTVPETPVGLPAVSSISADSGKACAIDLEGQVWCWGASGLELGIGASESAPNPPTKPAGSLVGKTAVQISTGTDVACAVASDGTLHCWGADGVYAGTGTQGRVLAPVQIGGSLAGQHVVQVSASDKFHMALDSRGGIHTWGFNDVPKRITALGSLKGKHIVQVRSDEGQRCAIDSLGSAHCWGDNAYGQLGLGNVSQVSVPTEVTKGGVAGKRVVAVTVHDEITYFIVASGVMAFPAKTKDSGSVTLDLSGLAGALGKSGATWKASGTAKSKGASVTFPIVRGSTKHLLLSGNLEIVSTNGSTTVLTSPIVDVGRGTISMVAHGTSAQHGGNRIDVFNIDSKIAKPKTVTTKKLKQRITTRTTSKLPLTMAEGSTVLLGGAWIPGTSWLPLDSWTAGASSGSYSSIWKATVTVK